MNDEMKDRAADHWVTCGGCSGMGQRASGKICDECDGKGYEDISSDTKPAAKIEALATARAEGYADGLLAAANIPRPDVSRRYCTNDEAFFNEGFAAAMSAILAAAAAKE